MVDYNKRLVEVDEILNHLSEEDLMKIPEEVRIAIKENKDKEYSWEYDETKTLENQNVSRDTIAFLSYLNMEYLLNEEQKEFMRQLHELNEQKLEEAKGNKCSTETLFNKNSIELEEQSEDEVEQEQALVEYNDNFFAKVIKRIRNFFGKLVG